MGSVREVLSIDEFKGAWYAWLYQRNLGDTLKRVDCLIGNVMVPILCHRGDYLYRDESDKIIADPFYFPHTINLATEDPIVQRLFQELVHKPQPKERTPSWPKDVYTFRENGEVRGRLDTFRLRYFANEGLMEQHVQIEEKKYSQLIPFEPYKGRGSTLVLLYRGFWARLQQSFLYYFPPTTSLRRRSFHAEKYQ